MTPEEIQKKIKLAHEIIKNEKEDSFKLVAFEAVLQYLLQQDIPNTQNKPYALKPSIPHDIEKQVEKMDDNKIKSRMIKLAENCGITFDQLKDVISIKNNEIQVFSLVKGTESEKQVTVSQCILITYHEILEHEWVKSNLLKECLRNSGIQDKSDHLSKNLKRQESIFRLRGSKGNAEYKLTSAGRISAYKIIKQLGTGE